MSRCVLLVLLGLLAPCLLPIAASAQSNSSVTARAYAPLPDLGNMVVLSKHDTDLNQRLTAEFERALVDAGYRLAPGGLEWHFDTEVSSDPVKVPPINIFGSFGNRSGANDFGATLRVPLRRGSADRTGNAMRMVVELRTAEEQLAWTAVMSSQLTRSDRFSLGRRMASEFVAMIGQDHDRVPVTLD